MEESQQCNRFNSNFIWVIISSIFIIICICFLIYSNSQV